MAVLLVQGKGPNLENNVVVRWGDKMDAFGAAKTAFLRVDETVASLEIY